jgi:hypothetical protein
VKALGGERTIPFIDTNDHEDIEDYGDIGVLQIVETRTIVKDYCYRNDLWGLLPYDPAV